MDRSTELHGAEQSAFDAERRVSIVLSQCRGQGDNGNRSRGAGSLSGSDGKGGRLERGRPGAGESVTTAGGARGDQAQPEAEGNGAAALVAAIGATGHECAVR